MKIIKVSDAVHEQLVADKKHFTETIGYSFKLSDVIKEYQKILRGYELERKKKRN